MREHAYASAEHDRRQANLARFGKVTEVDADTARARVQLGPDWISDFLPWFEPRAGAGLRTFSCPSVDETVMVLSATGETGAGVILRGMFSDEVAAPADSEDVTVMGLWGDGSLDQYDASTKTRIISLPAGSTLLFKVGDGSVLSITDSAIVARAAEVVTDGSTRLNNGTRQVTFAGAGTTRGDQTAEGANGVYV